MGMFWRTNFGPVSFSTSLLPIHHFYIDHNAPLYSISFFFLFVLFIQATATHGPVVERARAWCQMVGVPYYRFSSPMSSDVGLDETDDRILVKMLWETRVYVLQNFKEFTELGKKLTSWSDLTSSETDSDFLVVETVHVTSRASNSSSVLTVGWHFTSTYILNY